MASHSLRPFSFRQLPSATTPKTEYFETLDFISKFSSSLPLPKQATTNNETQIENMPKWVEKLAADKGADLRFVWKIMEKQIYASDASDQQNRFMINKQIVEEWIMYALTTEEIEAVNLTNIAKLTPSKKQKVCVGKGKSEERKHGREHGGLEVLVYSRNGWSYFLYLTRRDASKACVLKGGTYREFHHRSYFAVGDQVEMWAFRNGEGKFCLVIGNKVDLEISL